MTDGGHAKAKPKGAAHGRDSEEVFSGPRPTVRWSKRGSAHRDFGVVEYRGPSRWTLPSLVAGDSGKMNKISSVQSTPLAIFRAMALGHILLRSIANPRVAVPIAGGVLILLCWWGVSASHLARQIDRREPTSMRLEEAVAASKDGELYVRVSDAQLDCDKALTGSFGQAFALLDHARSRRGHGYATELRCEQGTCVGGRVPPSPVFTIRGSRWGGLERHARSLGLSRF